MIPKVEIEWQAKWRWNNNQPEESIAMKVEIE
jgi:hypothetical protein